MKGFLKKKNNDDCMLPSHKGYAATQNKIIQ